jgi:hypothetical protein
VHSKIFWGDIVIFIIVLKIPYFIVDVGTCRWGVEELELGKVQA